MTRLEDIKKAVATLDPAEREAFRRWFESFTASPFTDRQWDEQIERDASAGKFDELAHQAVADHKKGRSKAL